MFILHFNHNTARSSSATIVSLFFATIFKDTHGFKF